MIAYVRPSLFFFFNDTATTEIYTLSLHDALPISSALRGDSMQDVIFNGSVNRAPLARCSVELSFDNSLGRSEEHTSELQSHLNLVCRLLLEKKKTKSGWPCAV